MLASALMLALAAPSAAKVKFKIEGRGFGHGVGMSQWGAYGFATEGRGAERIVSHYYRGTRVSRSVANRQIRILLSVRDREIAFSGARAACGKKLKPSKLYRAKLGGSKVSLTAGGGKRIARCGTELVAAGKRGVSIAGDGSYRGNLVARASGGDLLAINQLPLDDYIKGVIPNESPASWPAAALEAQAIVARSYALATDAGGSGFDQYDDTRSQVYGGRASEQASTNRAAGKTAGKVVRYRGEVVPTFFFSTSGGRTENVEFGFSGGAPKPYLRSVKDPHDDASPYHRWSLVMSRSQMESKLGDLVAGKLHKIKVTQTGVSPRIVRARVIGSAGSRSVSGPELRTRLGLRSTWAKFKRVRR
ncbi:MAG: SpoIID/LytB domain-containing protein [Solirubrobacterales bacterium]